MYNAPVMEMLHKYFLLSPVLPDEFDQKKHYESYYRSIYDKRYYLCDQT